MESISIESIKNLLPNAGLVVAEVWADILAAIECPDDFQSLQFVADILESMYINYPALFIETFSLSTAFNKTYFNCFSVVNFDRYPYYDKPVLPKGSKSNRPIYSMIFMFYENFDHKFIRTLLILLKHYFENELVIKRRGKLEDISRAFRLLYTDQSFEHQILLSGDINRMANNLEAYKENLSSNAEPSKNPTFANYTRELIHFLRLDWSSSKVTDRRSTKRMRGYYSRTKYERVLGAENIFTYKFNKLTQSSEYRASGIAAEEDYPPLLFIKTEVSNQNRPIFELPDKAVIRDIHKDRLAQIAIQRESKKAHNLSLTSRTILQRYEVNYLLDELLSERNGSLSGVDRQRVRVLTLLCLLLGRPVEEVAGLKRIDQGSTDPLGLCRKPEGWYLKAFHRSTTERGLQTCNTHLLAASTNIEIQLPNWLTSPLDKLGLELGEYIYRSINSGTGRKSVDQLLDSINKKYNCQISLKKISNHLINVVIAHERYDPVLLEPLTGSPSYYTRAARHYAWYSKSDMNAQLNALFDDLFQVEAVGTNQFDLNLTDSCDEDVVGVGSQFTPRFKILQKMITELQGKLTQYRAFEASKTLSSLFEYHNNYTLYTLYMIINATGYRAVGNPLPSFNLFLNRYHALCISDKDNMTTFAHMRVVACVPVLGRQLNHYLDHIKAMARLMSIVLPNYAEQYKRHSSPVQFTDLKSKNARLDWFINAKNSKGNDGLFLFFDLISSGKVNVVNAYPKSVSEHSKGLPELPINFGRHYLRRYLQLKDVHQELVKFQMGHWVVGENPLELFSTLNFKEAIMSLNSVLQQMMDELGWQDIPSLLTRKRV